LLLHGFTGSPYELRPLAERLAALGLRVHLPLLPGHGSTPEALSPFGWNDFVSAARGHFDALAAEGAPVLVGGLSMGALLGLDLCLDPARAPKIRGFLSCATALSLQPNHARVLRALGRLGERMPAVYMPKRGGPDVRDPRVARETPAYKTLPLRAARALVVGADSLRPRLDALRTPLLALHGLLDRTCLLEGSITLLRRASSEEKSLVVLGRSGHLVTVDVERDAVERQVLAFVERHA
jgi:carboxylesterase